MLEEALAVIPLPSSCFKCPLHHPLLFFLHFGSHPHEQMTNAQPVLLHVVYFADPCVNIRVQSGFKVAAVAIDDDLFKIPSTYSAVDDLNTSLWWPEDEEDMSNLHGGASPMCRRFRSVCTLFVICVNLSCGRFCLQITHQCNSRRRCCCSWLFRRVFAVTDLRLEIWT